MTRPIVWSIAGSDSGGGAGIQADIPAILALGGHPATVVSALTAQNSLGVQAVEPTGMTLFEQQLQSLASDLPPQAVKIGLLAEPWQIRLLAEGLPDWRQRWQMPVVLDPVLVAASGDSLAADEVIAALHDLLPAVDMVTPNVPELRALTGHACDHLHDAIEAAHTLLEQGCRSVLVKGGHGDWDTAEGQCVDALVCADTVWCLAQPRLQTPHTHGTGCTLSSAIATAMATGHPPEDAVVMASRYLHQGLRQAYATGAGAGTPERWQREEGSSAAHYPSWIALPGEPAVVESFLDCIWRPLGLYPVVPDSRWVARVLKAGARTVQLRLKDPEHPRLREEIQAAVQLGQQYGAQVFINDHWQLAIELGAFGVHLGQEDLATADLDAIRHAGLRLGLSTHGYAELLRALALRPSYVALGHVFPTRTKTMPSQPQGLDRLRVYQAMADRAGIPTTAIGGIKQQHLPALRACGVHSVAVVTAITEADDPEAALRELMAGLEGQAVEEATT
ncbi:thiamine phosphate synthase [Natronospirillum operosum]|uniref:Thiamine-phosphate synthase n=1 Tax=Natronospirillum operosum TaxID=2759953 RepID=A0A4Z0W4V2_9GAMM|nr:thiamine phosphate synthase [Natronospirillum operosum]TGG90415.1 thiamine phosphate synthase [Natronospirillum operosum]